MPEIFPFFLIVLKAMSISELSEQEVIRRNSLQKMKELGIDPFPAAQYQLTIFLQGQYPLNGFFVVIGFFWALIMIFFALKLWKFSLSKYEAVGA